MAAVGGTAKRPRAGVLESLYAYGYIAPAMIAMIIASFIPIAFTVFVAFTNWDQFHPALVGGNNCTSLPLIGGCFHLIGLSNFKEIWDSLGTEVIGVVIWTIAFAAISTAGNFFIGLFLAFLLNNPNMRERNVYRTLLILPWAIPGSIMLLAWSGLLDEAYGPINVFIGNLFHLQHIAWLTDPKWARFSVVMVNFWFGFPFMMTACLGALQSIPVELGEAAMVDGAGVLTRFWRVTFPMLRSATLPLVISTFAYNLNNFGAVYLLTAGGPLTPPSHAGATDILPTYTYSLAWNLYRYGLACAYSILIFIFVGGFSFINMMYSGAFKEVDR